MTTETISFNSTLLNLAPFGLIKNEELESELRQKGMEIFDFTIGDPQEPTPEFIRQSLHDHISQVSQYPSTNGLLTLRTAASEWLQKRFQVSVDPKKQIISSN